MYELFVTNIFGKIQTLTQLTARQHQLNVSQYKCFVNIKTYS